MVQCDALLLLMGIPPFNINHFFTWGTTGTPGGMFGFVDKELDAFKEFLGGLVGGKVSTCQLGMRIYPLVI
jgi:hypothetical protein